MGLLSIEEELEETRKALQGVGVTAEDVAKEAARGIKDSLLTPAAVEEAAMPMSPKQQAIEEYGKGGYLMRKLATKIPLLTPSFVDDMILPQLSRENRDKYASDMKIHRAAALKRAEKRAELAVMDPQVEQLAEWYEKNGQPLLAMQILAANSIKDVDLNPRTLSTNQDLVSPTGTVIASGFKDPLAGMPAPVRQAAYIEQNPHMADRVERQAKIIKDVQNAGDVANATTGGTNDANTYRDQSNYYIDAVRNDRVIADRVDVLNEGLAMFDPSREGGAVDTGFIAGTLFNMFGLGSEDQGRLSQMSIAEAMEELSNFKGPTTDFEFEKSELKAFASIMRGEDVNVGTLKSARDGLERMRKRNALNAQSALTLATERDTGGKRIPGLIKAYPQPQYMTDLFKEAESVQSTTDTVSAPKAGDVIDGYRFLGGNPKDPASWEQAQ